MRVIIITELSGWIMIISVSFISISEDISRLIRGLLRNFLLLSSPPRVDMSMEDFAEASKAFGKVVNHTLRKSDIMMQSRTNQYFILLPEMTDRYIEKVRERIMYQWEYSEYYDVTIIKFEADTMVAQDDE